MRWSVLVGGGGGGGGGVVHNATHDGGGGQANEKGPRGAQHLRPSCER